MLMVLSRSTSFAELLERARSAERAGQLPDARSAYSAALRILPPAGQAAHASEIIRWIGSAHLKEGDSEAAIDCFTASLTIAELNADSSNEAYALNSIAACHLQAGELDQADHFYSAAATRGVEVEGESNRLKLLGMVHHNRGIIANIRGELDSALECYLASLEVFNSLGEDKFRAQLLNNLGMIYTDLRRWQDARTCFEQSRSLSSELGDLRTSVTVETNLAELHLLQGELAEARESCDRAFELASQLEHHLALGEVYKWYGVIYRETGKLNLAEAHLRTATEIAEKYSSPLLVGEVQRELAEVYRILERNRDALLALNYAHRIFNDLRAELDLADTDRRLHDLEDIFLEVVRKWGESIESKDLYTAGHCQRVADYGCMLAREVGFDEQTLVWFRMGAFLHDVGKTAIPAGLLNKEGALSADEWLLMKQHTLRGVELIEPIQFPWDIAPMVRSHHERWDGSGYPDGLEARSIPLAARILCVADVFDALTTTRSYREAFSHEKALEIMEADCGRIFDPELFYLFKNRISAGFVSPGTESLAT